jgi:DNA repair protein RadC
MSNPAYDAFDTPIRTWAEEDRPREKLMLRGLASLSNAELLAILIGSGTRSMSAVELSRKILQNVEHDLHQLSRLSVQDLMKTPGIGEAKAISIVSALELGRRKTNTSLAKKPKITSSSDAYHLMKPYLQDLPHEEFWVLLLNRSNQVIKTERISAGGVAGTVADPKMIFKKALDMLASAMILVHNHPSGNTKPSQSDIQLTKKIKQGGEMLEISVLDHLIFTDEGYFSFNDEGLLS